MASIVVAGAIGGAVGGTIAHLREKEEMKKRDAELEEERKREREEEREKQGKRAAEVGMRHFKHDHPLNEVHAEEEEEFLCGGCKSTGRGRRFRCEEEEQHGGCAGFQMHTFCASSPVMLVPDFQPDSVPDLAVQTMDTFAHQGHRVKEVYKHGDKFQCGHCNINGEGVRFFCDECNFSLHPICAKSPTRLSSFMHPEHELELITRPAFADCATCGHGGKRYNRVYACQQCKFYLHPTCSQWPQYLFHELHPVVHPLQFEILSSSSSSQRRCSACKKKCKASLYHCENCDESFHPDCLLRFSLSGSADGKMDKFRKEVVTHTIFHVGFIGAKSAVGLVFI